MSYLDWFKPYTPKIQGELEAYIRSHPGGNVDNLFRGAKYFFVMKKNGWMIPGQTWIRVDQSPIPDISYRINSDFLLESRGRGQENMSCVGAEKGVYDPAKALRRKNWSIYCLKLPRAQ